MDYGDDWPPAPEAEEFDRAVREEMRRIGMGRRARARQDAANATKRRRRHYETLIILAATAIFIIGWDHERGPVDLNRPTDVTSTLPPHPATPARHP
jgi:hypothetical protein